MQEENELDEVVKLVGMDALSPEDRLTLEVARSIREDFLQQDAFDKDDAYTPLKQQNALLGLIFRFRDDALKAIAKNVDIEAIADMKVREKIARAKSAPEDRYEEEYKEIAKEIDTETEQLIKQGGSGR